MKFYEDNHSLVKSFNFPSNKSWIWLFLKKTLKKKTGLFEKTCSTCAKKKTCLSLLMLWHSNCIFVIVIVRFNKTIFLSTFYIDMALSIEKAHSELRVLIRVPFVIYILSSAQMWTTPFLLTTQNMYKKTFDAYYLRDKINISNFALEQICKSVRDCACESPRIIICVR
jgi:hypothetical protein